MQPDQPKKYPALFLEGGNSVGKNELLRSIAKRVLMANPTKKILLMNFPQFWFFGHDIRLVIRGACDDILSSVSGIENAMIRSSLYGMDRDIALLLAEPYLAADPDIFVLSDRGPYSSCVTTGYLWAHGVLTEEQVKNEIVPYAFQHADEGLLTYFDAKSLLCTTNEEFALGKRKALDNQENELVQRYSTEVYRMLGLPEIITRQGNEWRPRDELACEALSQCGYGELARCVFSDSKSVNSDKDKVLLQAFRDGRIIVVGPELFLKHFQAKHLGNGTLKKLNERWVELSLGDGKTSRRDRKELLDDIETKIALILKRRIQSLDFLNTRKSPHAKRAIAKLLEQHPVLYDILARTSGKAMLTFFEGLLSSEQLRLIS